MNFFNGWKSAHVALTSKREKGKGSAKKKVPAAAGCCGDLDGSDANFRLDTPSIDQEEYYNDESQFSHQWLQGEGDENLTEWNPDLNANSYLEMDQSEYVEETNCETRKRKRKDVQHVEESFNEEENLESADIADDWNNEKMIKHEGEFNEDDGNRQLGNEEGSGKGSDL